MKTCLIIGGGFAGCAAAHQISLLGGWRVVLVEQGRVLGAGVRTQWYGGHPYTFGPRHFLTKNEAVYRYLDGIIPLRRCGDHEFWTYVEQDAQFYNFPIHADDVKKAPNWHEISKELEARSSAPVKAANLEEYWVASVGHTLYEKLIEPYNKKMWMVDDCRTIDTFSWSSKGATLKTGPRAAWSEALSAYPKAANGYDDYFDIATADALVATNGIWHPLDIQNRYFYIGKQDGTGVRVKFDVVISTISPDILFENCYGKLPYLGRDIQLMVLPIKYAFPEHVYWAYYAGREQFTRVTEYKKFTLHDSDSTLLGIETPNHKGRHYPMPFKEELRRAARYHAAMPENFYSIGRAGSYRYIVDIDDCIEQAMAVAEQVKGGYGGHPVPDAKWRAI